MYALYEDAATPPQLPPRGPGFMTAIGTPRNCRAWAGGEAGHNHKPRRGYMDTVSACDCHQARMHAGLGVACRQPLHGLIASLQEMTHSAAIV